MKSTNKSNKLLISLVFLFILTIPLVSATVGDLVLTIGQNYVISSVPVIGQVYSAVQLAQQAVTLATVVTGGPAAIAALGGDFALSQIKAIGLNKILGKEVVSTVSQIESYGDILAKDSKLNKVEIDKKTGDIKSLSSEIKSQDGKTTNTLKASNVKIITNPDWKEENRKGYVATRGPVAEIVAQKMIFSEEGSLTIKSKVGTTEEKIYSYENMEKDSFVEVNADGEILNAHLKTMNASVIELPGVSPLTVPEGTEVTFETRYGNRFVTVKKGKETKNIVWGNFSIQMFDDIELQLGSISGKEFRIGDIYVKGVNGKNGYLGIENNGFLLIDGEAQIGKKLSVSISSRKIKDNEVFEFSDRPVFLTELDESKIPPEYKNFISYDGKLVMKGKVSATLQPGLQWGTDVKEDDAVKFDLFGGRASLEKGAVDISFPNAESDPNQEVFYQNGKTIVAAGPDEVRGWKSDDPLSSAFQNVTVHLMYPGPADVFYIDDNNNCNLFTCTPTPKTTFPTSKIIAGVLAAGETCTEVGTIYSSRAESETKKETFKDVALTRPITEIKKDLVSVNDIVKSSPETLKGTVTLNYISHEAYLYKKEGMEIYIIQDIGTIFKYEKSDQTYFICDIDNDGKMDAMVTIPDKLSKYTRIQQLRMDPTLDVLSAMKTRKLDKTFIDLELSTKNMMPSGKTAYDERNVFLIDHNTKKINVYSYEGEGSIAEDVGGRYNSMSNIYSSFLQSIKGKLTKK